MPQSHHRPSSITPFVLYESEVSLSRNIRFCFVDCVTFRAVSSA
jgi:hypothetical protein